MKIHERLKLLREDNDLTQEEAARALKTTRKTLKPLLLWGLTENRYRDKGGVPDGPLVMKAARN